MNQSHLIITLLILVSTVTKFVQGCQDNESSATCQKHKKNGYCSTSSAFYHIAKAACARTCGFCTCLDQQPKEYCSQWKSSGFCSKTSRWHDYMRKLCAGTCEFCIKPTTQPPTPTMASGCKDTNDYCDSYKNYCTDPKYVQFLQTSCKVTCNYCHITTTQQPTTIPAVTKPYVVPGGSEKHQPGCGRKGPGLTRIVGGKAASPGEWPWQVTFDSKHNTMNPGHACGGTLITDEWILSAAHCFADDRNKDSYWLTIGEYDLSKKDTKFEQRIPIEEMIIHPNYSSAANHDYDLVLIKLKGKARFDSHARTACLPDHNTTFPIGTNCIITGWGQLKEYGDRPQVLQEAAVPLIDRGVCQKAFNQLYYTVTSRMFCAGQSQGGIDSCEGDSGGPMVCEAANGKWYLWGVISWGVGCARAGFYGVYANTKLLRPWIDSIVFPNMHST